MERNIIGSTFCEHTTDDFLLGTRIKLFSLNKVSRFYILDENLHSLNFNYTFDTYEDKGYIYNLNIYEPFNFVCISLFIYRPKVEIHGFKSSVNFNSSHLFFVSDKDLDYKLEAVNWNEERYPLNYYKKNIDDLYFYSVPLNLLFQNRYTLVINGEIHKSFYIGGGNSSGAH